MKKIGLYSIVFVILLSLISVNLTPGVTWAASSKDNLLQLQKKIIALTKEINALKSSVAQKDGELKSLKKQNGVNETTIKTLKGNAAAKDATLQDLNGKLATKDSMLQDLNGKLVTKDSMLQDLNGKLVTKDSMLQDVKGKLATNDSLLQDANGKLATKDSLLQDLNNKLATKDSLLAANDQKIKELQQKIAKYEGVIEPTTGNSRKNPAQPGETVTVEANDWEGYRNYSVTLTQTIEGQDAWSLIQAANQFNDAPKAGMKYILVKFKVKINKMDKEPFTVNNSLFKAVSSTGVLYNDFNSVVTPDPTLRTDLYVGAEHVGWAFFMVNENDHPVFVMNQKDPDEIWFKY